MAFTYKSCNLATALTSFADFVLFIMAAIANYI